MRGRRGFLLEVQHHAEPYKLCGHLGPVYMEVGDPR